MRSTTQHRLAPGTVRTPGPKVLVSATLVLAMLVLALLATPASAHPLGNFTTNTSAAVLVGTESIEIVYVLDLAEIPTQQTAAEIEAAGGDQDWAGEECRRIAEAQQLLLDGVEVPVDAAAAEIRFPEGEAGLDTLRLTCSLTTDAVAPGGPTDVVYADDVQTPRAGWREVIAVGNGTTLIDTDVPRESATDQLRDYPDGRSVPDHPGNAGGRPEPGRTPPPTPSAMPTSSRWPNQPAGWSAWWSPTPT